jgi:3-hydroxyisobutyrate dehydrogenase-like beta-hydroxyacid dehydrogenase
VAGATAGTLTFMVGGDVKVFEESKEVLSAMGKNMVHVGSAGTGGVTKLCNNLGLAIHMVGTAEAMNLVNDFSMGAVNKYKRLIRFVVFLSGSKTWHGS